MSRENSFYTYGCPTIHEDGTKCGSFLMAMDDDYNESITIFKTKLLAELSASNDFPDKEIPIVRIDFTVTPV
jgi:hypothetical protein